MISPELYYEEYLEGKTKEQIMTTIRGIKMEIGRLKNTIEDPDYDISSHMYPSLHTQIYWNRKYLEKAKLGYLEAGGIYKLSKAEEKAADFDMNIDSICEINFSIGGFFGGYHKYVVELSDDLNAYKKLWEDKEKLVLWNSDKKELFTKVSFIDELKNLHMEEWRRKYSTKRFGYMVCDGIQWDIKIEFNNGHKDVQFYGDNSYPYNFDKFQSLFGIDYTEDNQDE